MVSAYGTIDQTAIIHPKAEVHKNCRIGARTKIWQFASVLRGAVLGDDCTVASGACFDGSVAGNRVVLCHNLAAGPGFLLGNDVFIAPNVTLSNDGWPRAHKQGFDPKRFDGTQWAIIIEDGAAIGANSVVLPGVRLGRNCMVAAGSVVGKNVPENTLHMQDGTLKPFKREPVRMRFAGERETLHLKTEAA